MPLWQHCVAIVSSPTTRQPRHRHLHLGNSFAASVASCKLAYRARNLANRRNSPPTSAVCSCSFYFSTWIRPHIPYAISIVRIHVLLLLLLFSGCGMRRRRHATCEYFSWPLCGQLLLLFPHLRSAPPPPAMLLHFSLMTFYLPPLLLSCQKVKKKGKETKNHAYAALDFGFWSSLVMQHKTCQKFRFFFMQLAKEIVAIAFYAILICKSFRRVTKTQLLWEANSNSSKKIFTCLCIMAAKNFVPNGHQSEEKGFGSPRHPKKIGFNSVFIEFTKSN